MRTLTCITALSAALLMAHSAFAASAVVKACRTDIKSQCGDEAKSGGRPLKDCMEKHFSDLSEDCQVAIIREAALRKACKADAKKLCADVKPGKGTVAECMKSHAADLSDSCKEAMAKAERGK
jgi:Cysteine rich repeat